MKFPVILAMNVQYGILGVRDVSQYKGEEYPFPHGWKELLDAKLEFDQVDAEFESQEMVDAFVNRFKMIEDHWVPDTAEEAIKDAKITDLFYYEDCFRSYFTSPYNQYDEHIGKPFKVLGHDTEAEAEAEADADLEHPEDMYKIQFEDGTIITAWGHEVCILDRLKCKGRKYGSPEV
jgi:hypothetical protein